MLQGVPASFCKMPIAEVSGASIYFDTCGEGEPVILVPGFASGAWSWSWQTADLSSCFQVITFDPRGVSRSKLHDGAKVSIELLADDIASLMDELAIGTANLLGISFGGFVGQQFAIKYPDRLKRLVLASTSFGGPNHVMPSTETMASFAETGRLNSAERIRKNLVLAFSEDFAVQHADEVERFCTLREQNPLADDVYRQQLSSAMTFDVEDQLSQVLTAALVISGDRDTVVPFPNSVNLAARLPNAKLAVIADAGHMAFIERAEEFNRIVAKFLKEML